MDGAPVRYARSGGLDIAYKVVGAGPPDVVFVPGILDTIEADSFHEPSRAATQAISEFARVIKLDKRGTGLSDRLPSDAVPTIEARVEDIIAVMDAAGVERTGIAAAADGGPVAMVLAATHPERVSALALSATAPRVAYAPDWPWGTTRDEYELTLQGIDAAWGTGLVARFFGVTDKAGREEFARLERLAGTPSAARRIFVAQWETDVRSALPSIQAPTLITHYREHQLWPIESARYLADTIAEAVFVEYPGQPRGLGVGHGHDFVTRFEEMLTGTTSARPSQRVLRTVLFTDIVASTERLTELGDRRWREVLDAHDAEMLRTLERFNGRRVNSTGDGLFATFDGPARAIECARAAAVAARRLGVDIRQGIHTGECEVRGDDYAGIAVHIGARVASLAGAGEVLVTSTVRDLVAGSGIEFAEHGHHELKGVPGEWQILAVVYS